jgi:hypothetical protein
MLRVIVSAGHENIHQTTAEKIGTDSAHSLKWSTGALGKEAQWTSPGAAAGTNAKRTSTGPQANP